MCGDNLGEIIICESQHEEKWKKFKVINKVKSKRGKG
jgi:hypothetical protein